MGLSFPNKVQSIVESIINRSNMKSTSLIQLLFLPATLAFVQLEIVVKEDVYGYKVAAKGEESDFGVTDADTYEKDGLRCLNSNSKWTTECQD
jgi:hypothetical protein